LAKNTAVYLQTQLGEDTKISGLIIKIGTHRNQLNNTYKTSYGLTAFAWLHEKRMSMAQTLLKTTTLSILQVDVQVSYSDSNNFSTAFKRDYNFRLSIIGNPYLRSICAPNKGYRGCGKGLLIFRVVY
jgi:transcriptional regulator GlxA family with amidase domain